MAEARLLSSIDAGSGRWGFMWQSGWGHWESTSGEPGRLSFTQFQRALQEDWAERFGWKLEELLVVGQ